MPELFNFTSDTQRDVHAAVLALVEDAANIDIRGAKYVTPNFVVALYRTDRPDDENARHYIVLDPVEMEHNGVRLAEGLARQGIERLSAL